MGGEGLGNGLRIGCDFAPPQEATRLVHDVDTGGLHRDIERSIGGHENLLHAERRGQHRTRRRRTGSPGATPARLRHVSTAGQDLEPQFRALRVAGCTEIFEEKASGTSRARPELARALDRLGRGDTLVVVRIDRLARSLAHLLQVIERVREAGAHFRSLGDPIDTSGPVLSALAPNLPA
ncbi:recombinase family protein [Siccirubricoccus sp. G192]|uniref:recombinase family protein n=1 Tax=Siccirubricoccus sp. G192 TaxID=2849651 RepID=UPI001C2C424B|nr:recombinase family protein [Siccirubricoccus sp. G192]MBV1800520.1 recombinase family protein [Siccirubricoccus sp. G192]